MEQGARQVLQPQSGADGFWGLHTQIGKRLKETHSSYARDTTHKPLPFPLPRPPMASPWRSPWRRCSAIYPQFRITCSRTFTSATWHTQTAHASSRVQIYTSRSHNPYLNLSAEHFLLQNSHPDSSILFLYTNDPCVVIGRNQNPWLEVNLSLLNHFSAITNPETNTYSDIALVRRRSGGGAVFHDRGNVNFSVICPPAAFDRNRHAEMVVRALHGLGIPTARVNERHDIVVDAPAAHETDSTQTYKVSGSAYKLTRLRSLHHGTCLLSSPNLGDIGKVLRSPAEPYMKARGVDSVRSKIRNVDLTSDEFTEAVVEEFKEMYGEPDLEVTMGEARDAADFAHEQIQKGYSELTVRTTFSSQNSITKSWLILLFTQSREWIYNQTPQFTFSTHPSEEDPRDRPALPQGVPSDVSPFLSMQTRKSEICH